MVTHMGTRHVQTRVINTCQKNHNPKFEGQRHLTTN